MPLGQALGQAGIISPIPRRALRSRDHPSLHFDAPTLRTLFATTVAALLMTTIFTGAEQRRDS